MVGLGVIGVMIALWVLQKWLSSKQVEPIPISKYSYENTQVRKMPCGRFRKNRVELEGSAGVKIVQILDRDCATVVKEKRMPVDLESCEAIGQGVFVPDLWKDCQIQA